MKLSVTVGKATTSAIPELKKEAKTQYYLLIKGEGEEEVILNIGEKTFANIQKLKEVKK